MPGISKCLTYGITIITAKQRHSGWTTCLNSPVASMWKKLNLNLENLTPEASLEITAHGPHFTSLGRWNNLRNNLVWLLLQMRITWAQLSRTRSSTDHLKFVFLPSFYPPTHPFLCVCACVHMPWFLYRVQKTTCQSWFSPFIMWYPGLNTGHQTWQEMSLTTEPFCWLHLSFLKSSLTCCFRHCDQALVWWGPWGLLCMYLFISLSFSLICCQQDLHVYWRALEAALCP